MGGTPQAFLSYTRLDDQGHDGGITALRAALELQVRIVTGDDGFVIFQDVDGIAFGEHWPRRLDEALAAARFLIPVLSPRFFRSEPCRDELRKFLAHERAAGRDDLILPIYLVRAQVLEQPHLTAADELAAEIARRQRWDWRPHAFAPASDPAVRLAVRKLAEAIGERLQHETPSPAQPRAEARFSPILAVPRAGRSQAPVQGQKRGRQGVHENAIDMTVAEVLDRLEDHHPLEIEKQHSLVDPLIAKFLAAARDGKLVVRENRKART